MTGSRTTYERGIQTEGGEEEESKREDGGVDEQGEKEGDAEMEDLRDSPIRADESGVMALEIEEEKEERGRRPSFHSPEEELSSAEMHDFLFKAATMMKRVLDEKDAYDSLVGGINVEAGQLAWGRVCSLILYSLWFRLTTRQIEGRRQKVRLTF